MIFSILINESQGIAYDFSNIHNARPNGRLNSSIQRGAGKSIGAGVLVGHGGAHPSLDVANVPEKVLLTGSANALEFVDRFAKAIHGVADLLHTVLQSGVLSLLQSAELGKFPDEGSSGLSA